MCHPDQAPLDDSVVALRCSHATQINKPKWDARKMLPEAVKTGAVALCAGSRRPLTCTRYLSEHAILSIARCNRSRA